MADDGKDHKAQLSFSTKPGFTPEVMNTNVNITGETTFFDHTEIIPVQEPSKVIASQANYEINGSINIPANLPTVTVTFIITLFDRNNPNRVKIICVEAIITVG